MAGDANHAAAGAPSAATVGAFAENRRWPNCRPSCSGGGCFWCTEAVYVNVRGVTDVESGYCQRHRGPSRATSRSAPARTGHNEVVKLTYDPAQISTRQILEIFFVVHDPTTLNRQGNDVGTQYRSGIYYTSDEQKQVAEDIDPRAGRGQAVRPADRDRGRAAGATTRRPRPTTRTSSRRTRPRATAWRWPRPRSPSSARPSRNCRRAEPACCAGWRPGRSRSRCCWRRRWAPCTASCTRAWARPARTAPPSRVRPRCRRPPGPAGCSPAMRTRAAAGSSTS